jgi:hypothetical protein
MQISLYRIPLRPPTTDYMHGINRILGYIRLQSPLSPPLHSWNMETWRRISSI